MWHILSAQGIATNESKIEAFKKWPTMTNMTEVWSFLGFTVYYRWFIRKFMQMAWPLLDLTSGKNVGKKVAIVWDDRCQWSFDDLKCLCTMAPILAWVDFTRPFKLTTDACGSGLGPVLYQTHHDGMDAVIAYASRNLTKAESHYPAHKLEFLALKWAFIEKFHKDLYGLAFDVYTENNPWPMSWLQPSWMLQVTVGWPAWPITIFSCIILQGRPILMQMACQECPGQGAWAHLGHCSSSMSCAGGCYQRLHESSQSLQQQCACPGLSIGQPAGCLHDYRWLVSGSVGRPGLESHHCEATEGDSEPMPAQDNGSSQAMIVP